MGAGDRGVKYFSMHFIALYSCSMTEQANSPRYDERPWGSFTVLDEAPGYKVKRIEVLPQKRLSYQNHSQQ